MKRQILYHAIRQVQDALQNMIGEVMRMRGGTRQAQETIYGLLVWFLISSGGSLVVSLLLPLLLSLQTKDPLYRGSSFSTGVLPSDPLH